MARRRVFRNYFYVVLGLGIDVLLVAGALGAHLTAAGWVALALLLVPGARAALIRVVVRERGILVVNFWRTRRLGWREVQEFVAYEHNVERHMQVGRRGAFLALVALRARGGRAIPLSALSACATLTPTDQVHSRWLPAAVARLNSARAELARRG